MFVFRLDTHSGVPPYLQLVQQVRQAVLLGFLQPGDRLPLIREVVEDLAINPNTVAKAYRQMEQENLVTGRPGQGTFVTEQQSAAMSPSTYTSLRRGLATWLSRAYAAGLDEQAVDALFTSVHQQTRNEDVA
ncbi:GntR family transcriptional regulator [Micromonospora chalcea]|uniref:GntR family transcriptional regulator n=1 Tax=unclassified Micromonospora TaxID=2617518 RepID=UPI00093D0CBD|nr:MULTISPECIES: GntR family transcriptional regulator [unclassified Micromonospora]AXO35271.1 transcriptional regulator GntR family [Micromonospora sp. B006]OKJ45293.1 GntR family transcriptional regulator [Micromonospora sp. TSRI0369]